MVDYMKMDKNTETMALPVEGFAILIKSAAMAIVNEMNKAAEDIQPSFLHGQVGTLDELVGKFEILHRKEQESKK